MLEEIIALSGIKGLGNITLLGLITKAQERGITSFANHQGKAFVVNCVPVRLKNKVAELLENIEKHVSLANEKLQQWQQQEITVIAFNHSDYPASLKALKDAPPLLFCKGNISLLSSLRNKSAVIGPRTPTEQGSNNATQTTLSLINSNDVVVSGLAVGIDVIAHLTALENNGHTIAVIPDVLHVYPAKNKALAKDIVENNGLLLSENFPGTKFNSGQLVKRDRIQAGLCERLFAIESKQNGGTLHAVRTALLLERRVYIPDFLNTGYTDLGDLNLQGLLSFVQNKNVFTYIPTKIN